MQIMLSFILSFILSIIILIFFIYHFKINKEGMQIKVTGDMQPDLKSEIYDFNLRQAQGIWKDVGCTDGSYKPTKENINLWKHEEWREELKAYKTEADLNEKEHNYYDFQGKKEDDVTKLKYENRDAVGIGMANERCYDVSFNTNYTFPKLGDRIKIKENTKDTNTNYYSGIVLEGDVKNPTPLEVLWDAKGKENTMEKDIKRTETKTFSVQTDDKKIEKDSEEFGWPYQKWDRHPDTNREMDKSVSKKDWIKMNDMGKVDSKIVYKTTECDPGSNCDNLNCSYRSKEMLNRYPITYYCEGDKRNERPLGTGYMCKSGAKKGMITQYYDEVKMCFKDEKGNSFGRKFALEECGGVGNIEDYNGIKNLFGGECYALISDKNNGEGNRAIIKDKKKYTSADLKKLGLKDGKIRGYELFGNEHCHANLDSGPRKKEPGVIKVEAGSGSIKLFKEEKGCKLVINKEEGKAIYDKESTAVGLKKGGTKFNAAQLVSKGLGSIKNYKLYSSGGFDNKEDLCRVAFYNWPVAQSNKYVKPQILSSKDDKETKVTGALSAHIFKRIIPILSPGKYTIRSRRTGEKCYTYYEKDFWGDKTGKVFWQCDNYKGNGPKKDDVFNLELIDERDPSEGYYIKQGKHCKHERIGAGYNIKCDSGGSSSSSKSKFKITKGSRNGYHKIKNVGTGKFCTNRRDILMPGGGIIACNGAGSNTWQEYEFVKA
tara:strand:- start:8849 stop:10990 length:2142 start_codon:yes stop_codon:yes gene_type:complete